MHELPGGGFVVNDAYNANPVSMRAALVDLAERAAGRRRVAVLGGMAELGAESARYHDEIRGLLGELESRWSLPSATTRARTSMTESETHFVVDAPASTRSPKPFSTGRRDPRQGVASGRSRRHPGADRETLPGMVRVLIAGLVAMVIAVAAGPSSSSGCDGSRSASTFARRAPQGTRPSRARRPWEVC